MGVGSGFEKLKLSHIGAQAADGVSLLDEVRGELSTLADLVLDERYGDRASLTVTFDIEAADALSVKIDAKTAIKRPKRRHKGVLAYVGQKGELKVARAEQLELPSITPLRAAAKQRGPDPDDPPGDADDDGGGAPKND